MDSYSKSILYFNIFYYRLINWLTKWYVNRKAKLAKPSPWAKNDDGGYFKAALLSGPPGVGELHVKYNSFRYN